MLRNAVGGGRVSYLLTNFSSGFSHYVSYFHEKGTTKMYGSTLLALRRGGCQISRKKRYVTLEWPLKTQSALMQQEMFNIFRRCVQGPQPTPHYTIIIRPNHLNTSMPHQSTVAPLYCSRHPITQTLPCFTTTPAHCSIPHHSTILRLHHATGQPLHNQFNSKKYIFNTTRSTYNFFAHDMLNRARAEDRAYVGSFPIIYNKLETYENKE